MHTGSDKKDISTYWHRHCYWNIQKETEVFCLTSNRTASAFAALFYRELVFYKSGMGSRPACSRLRPRPKPVVFEVKAKAKARPGRGQAKAKSAKTSDYRVLEREPKSKSSIWCLDCRMNRMLQVQNCTWIDRWQNIKPLQLLYWENNL